MPCFAQSFSARFMAFSGPMSVLTGKEAPDFSPEFSVRKEKLKFYRVAFLVSDDHFYLSVVCCFWGFEAGGAGCAGGSFLKRPFWRNISMVRFLKNSHSSSERLLVRPRRILSASCCVGEVVGGVDSEFTVPPPRFPRGVPTPRRLLRSGFRVAGRCSR